MTDINLFITLAGTARHDHRYTEWQGAGGWQEGGGSQCGVWPSPVLSTQRRRRLPPVSFFNYAYILRV